MIKGWARAVAGWLGVRFSGGGGEAPSVDRVVSTFMNGLTTVGRDRALSVPALLKGRNVICSLGTLPLVQRDAANRRVESELLSQVDTDIANVVTLAMTLEDLLFDAISWWRVTARDPLGFPVAARHLATGSVSLQPPPGWNPSPLPSGEDPRHAFVWVDGVQTSARNVIRFDSPNPGLLRVAAEVIRRAIAIDLAARMYSDNPVPLDYFTPNGEVDPVTDDEVQEILDNWRASRKRRTTGYVPAALTYNTVDLMSPRDLQLVDLQRQASLDIANAIGLDPEDVGVSTTSRTYQNATDRRQDKINDVLAPYMRAITDRLSMGDISPAGLHVEFDLSLYLRADPKTRAEVASLAIKDGWKTPQDVQRDEGLEEQVIEPPAPPAPPVDQLPDNVRPIRPLAAAGMGDPWQLTFDAAAVQRVAFAALEPLAVDWENRTISGIVMPYGKTSVVIKNGRRWQFQPGALKFSSLANVKLLRDHDFAQSQGRAVEEQERPEGKWVKFSVGRGPDGDRTLAEAEDGVRDAFSCGVLIRAFEKHPTEVGTYVVTDAFWQETSVLSVPAFDDARLAADGTQQGDPMHNCPTCGVQMTPGVAHACATPVAVTPPVTPPATAPVLAGQFDPAQFGAFAAAFSAWQQQNLSVPIGPAQPVLPAAGPTVVNPHAAGATGAVTVVEAEPYRFGAGMDFPRRGTHEFSSDAFAFFNGDQAAGRRVSAFLEKFAAVATGDVNELNPTTNRPEMYVDQRDYRYPLWETINKGVLTDVSPFTFPKFSSASGLVGNHTEGTEPTEGTFVTTGATVTPTAVSGKMGINREVIDQGGNPQVTQLIWRQMTKAYYEALEAYGVALLDAATPTAIALTAGGGTTGQTLASELTAAIARLQFVRGGFSFESAFAQIDLYLALAGAKDADGRPLFPQIGPSNANGQVTSRLTRIDVNGVLFNPEWALAATGSVVASSYLIDPNSVWGWASAPRELRFDYEVAQLHIGLWGYKAGVITDITGVREITYDPVP